MNSDILSAAEESQGRRLVIIVIVLPFVVFWGRLLLRLPRLLRSKALACEREAGPCTDDATEALYELKKKGRKGQGKKKIWKLDRQPVAELNTEL